MQTAFPRRNVPTAKNLHPAVYGALVFCTLWIVAAIWAFFARDAYAALQLAVSTFFAAVFLLTPLLLQRLGRKPAEPAVSFDTWSKGEFATVDGAIEARHAVAMVLMAPVAIATGLTAIGFIARLAAIGAI